jgi:hypothetical protein
MAIQQWLKIKDFEVIGNGSLNFTCGCGTLVTIDGRLFERQCPCACGRIYRASRTLQLKLIKRTATELQLEKELAELRRQLQEADNHRAFLLRKVKEQNG